MNHSTDSFPGREVSIDGNSYLYFGGTAYLGLQTNTDFQDLYIRNIRKYGTNYGASRKSNIQLSIFRQAEAALATMTGSEACATLSSGYLAGQLVAKHFSSEDFQCFYAPNSHSAIFQKGTVPFKTFKELVAALKKSNQGKTPVIFLDSVDTLEASYPNFTGIDDLILKEVILVVDDSHGIGIMGEQGGGAYKMLKRKKPKELIVCCSLGKGLGIQAGAIFGKKERIDRFKNTSLFGGASPAAPAALATLTDAQLLYKKQRVLLRENLELFLKTIISLNDFHFIKNHPIFTFKNPELMAYLEEHKILATNFNYPNNQGMLVSRIVISAAHLKEDIDYLTGKLNSYKNKNI